MTPRQSQTLTFVREFWAENGFSPSYDEIRDALGLKSKSGVWFFLNSLEKQGYIVRSFNQVRSVTPVELLPALEGAENDDESDETGEEPSEAESSEEEVAEVAENQASDEDEDGERLSEEAEREAVTPWG